MGIRKDPMPSPSESPLPIDSRPTSRRRGPPSAQTFALCLLLSASLQIMENLLPRIPIFPWLKLGLSHVILLPFLLYFGPVAACMLLLGRNLLTLVFAGQALTTFLIGSASGSVTLLLGGYLAAAAYRRRLLGLLGVGMLLAALMNLSQLLVVESLLIHHRAFFFQVAPMLFWSALSGGAVAYLAWRARDFLGDLFRDPEPGSGEAWPPGLAEPARSPLPFLVGMGALIGLFLLPGTAWQAAVLGLLLAAAPLRGRGWRGLGADLSALARAWPWFAYLGWLHLFLGEGEYLFRDWITRQGAEAFLFFGIRLANLILLGPWLAATFPRRWLAASPSVYARGMLGCLPLLPGIYPASMKAGAAFFRAWRGRREDSVLKEMADGFRRGLAGGP